MAKKRLVYFKSIEELSRFVRNRVSPTPVLSVGEGSGRNFARSLELEGQIPRGLNNYDSAELNLSPAVHRDRFVLRDSGS
jgi:hypothetical protein